MLNDQNSFTLAYQTPFRNRHFRTCVATLGRMWSVFGQDPSVFNIAWLHVDIFGFFFYYSNVYYGISSKSMGDHFHEFLNQNWLFLKHIRFSSSVTGCWFPPFIHWYVAQGSGRTGCQLQMNRLSLRNNRLKFETSREITDHYKGICGIYLKWTKAKPEDINM